MTTKEGQGWELGSLAQNHPAPHWTPSASKNPCKEGPLGCQRVPSPVPEQGPLQGELFRQMPTPAFGWVLGRLFFRTASGLAALREWWVAAAGPSGGLAMTSSKAGIRACSEIRGTMQSARHPFIEPFLRKGRSPDWGLLSLWVVCWLKNPGAPRPGVGRTHSLRRPGLRGCQFERHPEHPFQMAPVWPLGPQPRPGSRGAILVDPGPPGTLTGRGRAWQSEESQAGELGPQGKTRMENLQVKPLLG